YFFFSSRRRHTRSDRDWSSDVCSSDLHDIEDRMTALALQDVHRKLHAAEIFIVRKNTFEERVPGQTGIDLGLDVLDEILLVDRKIGRASCRVSWLDRVEV